MKQQANAPEIVDLDQETADEIVHRLEASNLPEQDRRIIGALFASYLYIVQLLQFKKITVARLKKFIFGSRSEKTEAVLASLGQEGDASGGEGASGEAETTADHAAAEAATESAGGAEQDTKPDPPSKRRKGHGRNGVKDFPGAERQVVRHPTLQAGDDCPQCGEGTVYGWTRSSPLIRFTAQPPIQVTIFELEQLRCSLCGTLFTAPVPEGVSQEKYDPSVGILLGLLRYGHGFPMYRLGKLQASLGMPLAPSTQYKRVEEVAEILYPVYEELARQAAQGDVLYHDDTGMRILSLMGKRREATLAAQASQDAEGSAPIGGAPPPIIGAEADLPSREPPPLDAEGNLPGGEPPPVDKESMSAGGQGTLDPKRTGMFTTGIVATWEGHQVVLFVTGRRHGGENLRDILNLRDEGLPAPIQMCDPLSRNMPSDLQTILANCLAHGRRAFVDIVDHFPEKCLYVLQALKAIYKNDEIARRDGLSPEERLAFHQTHSQPVMDALKEWLHEQLDQRLVEPNSALGGAINYLLRHWKPFTLFLRQPGAPLDNNICERVLKKAILHRKNSLFYKNENGARVGDVFMSLIHTCELGGYNPWDYLQALVGHRQAAADNPAAWMPWNYQQTVASLSSPEPHPAAAMREAS